MSARRLLIVAAAIMVVASSNAEQTDAAHEHYSSGQLATAAALRDAALDGSHAYGLLEELVTTAPKRMPGSAGDAAARDWAVRKLEALGFDKVWVQEFPMPRWERVSADAVVSSHGDLKLDITSLGKSVSTPDGGITANVVHYATFEDLQAADASEVRGKIVFISNRMARQKDGSGYGPAVVARSQGHAETASKGGLAILIRSIGTDDHDAPHTGAMRFGVNDAAVEEEGIAYSDAWHAPYGVKTVAAAAVSNADADVLQKLVEGGETVTVSLNMKNHHPGEITSYNIIGEITGASRPDEIVITGGHIDAWDTGVGAMDDGMGVAITMNAAGLIADLPERPARTIRYVAFGAEELGLIGATAYAAEYGDEDHVFGIESDFGIGRVWKLTPAVSPEAIPVLEEIWSVLEPMGIGWDANGKGFPGPDLAPLVKKGMPGAALNGDGTRYFDLHHTAEDTLDKIEPSDLSFDSAAYAALLFLVAEYDGRFGG
jgi:Zn-dependent M28 family amino/carboxypeptidase